MTLLTQIQSCVALLLITTSTCDANMWTSVTEFTIGKAVSTSYKTFERFSEAQCVKKCNDERKKDMCSIAGYNRTSRVCALSVDSLDDLVDVADDMAGVFVMTDGEYRTR